MSTIPANLRAVADRISAACRKVGRDPAQVALLAVSKTWPAASVREAAVAGQRAFGESYVQEAAAKMSSLADLDLEWHFIGPLQANKTRSVAEHFSWVHSVDRLRVAERLSAQRPAAQPPLNVCVEVNVSGEDSKCGCPMAAAADLCRAVAALPRLRLRGLMTIPEGNGDNTMARRRFASLRALRDQFNNDQGLGMDALSMGMSQDLEAAIMEGATMVRVGTAIFGDRRTA